MQYRLPDPSKYHDPIRYFRDSHGVISVALEVLESVVHEAEKIGVNSYFSTHPEVRELIYFFTHIARIHERDEERTLFPVIRPKIPTIGFQMPDTTPAFLMKEHEQLNEKAASISRVWSTYLQSGNCDVENETLALQSAKDLIKLYREHLADENTLIYKVANDELLTPLERATIMAAIQDEHDEEVITTIFNYDSPNYTIVNMSDENDTDDD